MRLANSRQFRKPLRNWHNLCIFYPQMLGRSLLLKIPFHFAGLDYSAGIFKVTQ